jgi:HAMP domain-containing protein
MKNYQITILLVISLIVSAFSFRQCRRIKELQHNEDEVRYYDIKAKFYQGKNGKLIAYNNTVNTEIKALKKEKASLMDEIEDMRIKKPQTIIRTTSVTQIDSVFIPYEVPLKIVNDSFSARFSWRDSIWFNVSGTVTQSGVLIHQAGTQDELLLVIGNKDNGFFRRSEVIVAAKNSNPYTTINNLENYNIKPKVKFFDKLWFKVAIFGVGVAVGSQIK